MAHINPPLPADGQQAWAPVADNVLTTLVNQVNLHDDAIAAGLNNPTPSSATTLVDNGDGTGSLVPAVDNSQGGTITVDNGDGTSTLTTTAVTTPGGGGSGGGGTSVVDNGDGTSSVASGGTSSGIPSGSFALTDNHDGTITFQITQNFVTSSFVLYTKAGTDTAISRAGGIVTPGPTTGPSVTDNGDKTFTVIDATSALTDNGNGTFTIVYNSPILVDNANNTFTLTA
jgi:hypothetical protein